MIKFDFLTVTPFWNPFFIDGREIKKIHFFDKNGVIFSTRSGWFGSHNNQFRQGLKIPAAVYKRKIDFSIGQSFFVSVPAEHYEKGLYAELYLFVDGESVKIKDVKNYADQMTESDIWHSKIYTLEILGQEIRESILDHIEKTPFGEQVESLLSELENQKIEIGRYNLIKLLKHYNIVKK